MGLAWKEGCLSSDIVAEQKKIEAADLIIFQAREQGEILSSLDGLWAGLGRWIFGGVSLGGWGRR